jgi:cytochrome c-type biogenesis protein CcmF
VTALVSFGLVIYRLPLLRGRHELESYLSREFAFVVNNWILLSAAFFVLVATLFPTLSEALVHERITVGPPFFTKWMMPIGLTLLFLTGVGPLIAWRKASAENLQTQFVWPFSVGLGTSAILALFPSLRVTSRFLSDRIQLPVSIVCFGLCAFVTTTILQEFYRGARVRQSHTKLDLFTSLIGLVARGKRRYGGYLIHLAVVLMFVGFAGNTYKKESDASIERGQTIKVGRFTARFDGLRHEEDAQKAMVIADFSVLADGKPFAKMAPAKWIFRGHEEEPTTEVAIHKSAREDLYLVMNGYDFEAGLVNMKAVVNPLVNWIWIGFLLLIAGTVIAYLPDRAYALAGAREERDEGGRGKAVAAALVFLLVFSGGLARAQSDVPMAQAKDGPHYARNDRERKLFSEIVCMCGTCGRLALSECTCGVAAEMRKQIQALLDQGKSRDDIIAYELATYPGESALVVPLDRGFNRMAWLLPYGAILAGIGALVATARRWTRRGAAAMATAGSVSTEPHDEKYEAQLDDELDRLD